MLFLLLRALRAPVVVFYFRHVRLHDLDVEVDLQVVLLEIQALLLQLFQRLLVFDQTLLVLVDFVSNCLGGLFEKFLAFVELGELSLVASFHIFQLVDFLQQLVLLVLGFSNIVLVFR